MAKVALITDQHFQVRKFSRPFHDYFLKFYNDIFFDYLEKNNIDTVIDLGDTFDNRDNIDPAALNWAKVNYYDRLQALNIDHRIIVGNHTAKYKNTNRINSVSLILREYSNITVYSEPTEEVIKGKKILFIPWINSENEAQTYSLINNTDAPVAMGHLELNGFRPYPGQVMEDGRNSDIFSKFKKVFTGHFHTRSDNGTVFYIGNPYEIYFNDINDERGFVIFDTTTLEHEYINNPYKMHYNIYYEDSNIDSLNEDYENKIVRIIVRKKTDPVSFMSFIDDVNKMNPLELKIIESTEEFQIEEFEHVEIEDTLSIVNRYIDDTETIEELDRSRVKEIVRSTYKEALQSL